MAKIDISKIEGFADMTADQKLEALLSYEVVAENATPTADPEVEQLRKALSKANSEAADYKKQLRAKQSEAEIAEANRAEEDAKLRKRLEEYERKESVSNYKVKLMNLGHDEESAEKMATLLPNGISDDFFAAQKGFLEAQKKNIEAAALNQQPGLSVGKAPATNDVKESEFSQLRKWVGLPD